MAVDSQVRTPDGQAFDVIYVGTTKGRVLKIVNTADPNGGLAQRPVFIEELILYPASVPVDKLKVVRDEHGGRAKLVVLTKDQVAAVPLARCSLLAKSCGVCIALQDPYCAWSVRDGQCVSLVNSDPDRLDSAAYLQVSSYIIWSMLLLKDKSLEVEKCFVLSNFCQFWVWFVRDGQCVSLVNSDLDCLDSAAYLQVSSYYMINFTKDQVPWNKMLLRDVSSNFVSFEFGLFWFDLIWFWRVFFFGQKLKQKELFYCQYLNSKSLTFRINFFKNSGLLPLLVLLQEHLLL